MKEKRNWNKKKSEMRRNPKKPVRTSTGIDLDERKPVLHHVADNVDHNILTLGGHGIFHGKYISFYIQKNLSLMNTKLILKLKLKT